MTRHDTPRRPARENPEPIRRRPDTDATAELLAYLNDPVVASVWGDVVNP